MPQHERSSGPLNLAALIALVPPGLYWLAAVLGVIGMPAPYRLLAAQVPVAVRLAFVVLCPVIAMGLADAARRRVVTRGGAGRLAVALMTVGGVMTLLSVVAVLRINKATHSSASDGLPSPYVQSASAASVSAPGRALLPVTTQRLV